MRFTGVFLVLFLAQCTFCDVEHAEYDVKIKAIGDYRTTKVTVDVDKDNGIIRADVAEDPKKQFGAGLSYFDVKNNFAIFQSSSRTWCQVNMATTEPVNIDSTASLLLPPVFKAYEAVGDQKKYNETEYTIKKGRTNQDGVLPIVYCHSKDVGDTELPQAVKDAAAKECKDGKITRVATNCYRRAGLGSSPWYCVSAGVMATTEGLQMSCVTFTGNFGK